MPVDDVDLWSASIPPCSRDRPADSRDEVLRSIGFCLRAGKRKAERVRVGDQGSIPCDRTLQGDSARAAEGVEDCGSLTLYRVRAEKEVGDVRKELGRVGMEVMGELISHPQPADHRPEVDFHRGAGALKVGDKLLVRGGGVYHAPRLVSWNIDWSLLDWRKHLFDGPGARPSAGISSVIALPSSHALRLETIPLIASYRGIQGNTEPA